VVGGPTGNATEEYDGSTWTSNPTGLNTARNSLGGVGTQTSALAFGGEPQLQSWTTAATEEYDGTSLDNYYKFIYSKKMNLAGAGTQTAGLGFWRRTSRYWCYSSNRRMDRSRSSSNKNNYSKLTGGKYGNKNIHRS
jgi:hypothetical protein